MKKIILIAFLFASTINFAIAQTSKHLTNEQIEQLKITKNSSGQIVGMDFAEVFEKVGFETFINAMFDILGSSKINYYSEKSELYGTYIKNDSKVGFLKVDEKVAPDEDEPTDGDITPHLYENKRNWARRDGCRRHRRSLCILYY